MSIRAKWVLSFFILIALTLGFEAFALVHWVREDLQRQLLFRLKTQAELLVTLVEQNLSRSGDLRAAAQLALTSQHLDPSLRVVVAGDDGSIVFDSASPGKPSGILSPEALLALGGSGEMSWRAFGRSFVARPVRQVGEIAGVVQCEAPEASFFPTLDLLKHALWETIVVALLVGIGLSIVVSNTLVRPIQELETVTSQISKGEWNRRVSFRRRDELGQLADTVHAMAEELKQQFSQLEEEKTTLSSLFSSMIDGLIVLDDQRNVRFLNPEAERALRVKLGDSVGKQLDFIWPLQDVLDLVAGALEQKKVLSREISLPYNVLKVYVVPVSRVTGASAMLIFRDITEFRQLEKTRNEFLGQVSHELRTPLTIIKGYVVTLLDDPLLPGSGDIKKILLRIEEEADRLSKLVEELLEFSKLKSGRSPLTFAPISMEDLVKDTVEGFRHHADRYRIRVEFSSDGDIPQMMGDSNRLKQVILNLLDNAVKYTAPGGYVEVKLSAPPDGILLSVSDSGYGIPEEELPHIFERFFQGERKPRGKGFGLGLPIVKEIVEAHGGRLEIRSSPGKGTGVHVLFPSGGLVTER